MKHIVVSDRIHSELTILKAKFGARKYEQVIEKLLDLAKKEAE